MIQLKEFKYKQLPSEWLWLLDVKEPPKMIVEALQHYGILEHVGKGSNPDISKWAKELDLENTYSDDDIPWCGLFIAIVAKRCDKTIVKNPLWARNWLNFGEKAITPMFGDVLVFKRGNGGHVGLYVGESKDAYAVLGGNQSNSVTITWISKNRLLGARRQYKVRPSSVKVIILSKSGKLSSNEA